MEVRHKIHGGVGKAVRLTQEPNFAPARVKVIWREAKLGAAPYPLLRNLVFRVPCGTRRLA